MGTGQMLLSVGAMVLLSTTLLNYNQSSANSNLTLMESKYSLLAISLANSLIEEATGKPFDAKTVSSSISSTNQLSSIGLDSHETFPNFDDFDDYDDLEITERTLPAAEFNIRCKVDYINPANPNVPAGGRTWHKKITVFISSHALSNTVEMSQVYSYFYFR
jgi:hypothetical protein